MSTVNLQGIVKNSPKQFIAEEKPLADGRNTYIISELDPNQPDIINKLRSTLTSSTLNNNIFNSEHVSLYFYHYILIWVDQLETFVSVNFLFFFF